MLKRQAQAVAQILLDQPPSGGCVLKPQIVGCVQSAKSQPPSGGCVLKQKDNHISIITHRSAAFRRLCVETAEQEAQIERDLQPPSGGCVLKPR